MTINTYVKKWCDEDYDIDKEDFYMENAYYVADREWAINGFKHGFFALFVSICSLLLNDGITWNVIHDAFTIIGILSLSFWFYGIRKYDANGLASCFPCYVLIAIFLFISKNKVPDIVQLLFTIPTFALYVYLSWVNPLKCFANAKKMEQRIEEEEREEEQESNAQYEKWKEGYKAFREGLPGADIQDESPVMIEARRLFKGYTDSQQMLKTRYRQLAKQYHPDKGGDTKLFQSIVEVYEELNKAFN